MKDYFSDEAIWQALKKLFSGSPVKKIFTGLGILFGCGITVILIPVIVILCSEMEVLLSIFIEFVFFANETRIPIAVIVIFDFLMLVIPAFERNKILCVVFKVLLVGVVIWTVFWFMMWCLIGIGVIFKDF